VEDTDETAANRLKREENALFEDVRQAVAVAGNGPPMPRGTH
jgi:hypothetical protein